jgi:hypothetical protein
VANSSTVAAPSCQRCKGQTTPLIKDGDRQRFECQRCGETFWGPALVGVPDPAAQTARPTAFVPIAIPEATAGPLGTCEKCLKPYYKLGKRYDAHIATCDGKKKYVAPRKRAKPVLAAPPTPSQVYELSLAAMRARKATLEAELRGLDVAIAEVEKLKAVGGPAVAPFADGRPVTP